MDSNSKTIGTPAPGSIRLAKTLKDLSDRGVLSEGAILVRDAMDEGPLDVTKVSDVSSAEGLELSKYKYGNDGLSDTACLDVPPKAKEGVYVRFEDVPKKNPKYVRAQKDGKTDWSCVPWEALHEIVGALNEGMNKYGRFNYLEDPIEARTYIGAISRHLMGDPGNGTLGWFNGEDIDEESGYHHLSKVAACCIVVLASLRAGTLIDNRFETESKEQ